MADHAHVEAPWQAPSYAVAADFYLWWVRGSADFITLGVHTRPPTDAEQVFVEYRRLPEADDLTDDRYERLLKAGFWARRRMDELERAWFPVP